ncbi:MAG TPA: ribonuclease PH [Myxococcales bacterium]|jgi:ribonuclease PH|nr:ribonuclease PH [Myxococcales bacterium]
MRSDGRGARDLRPLRFSPGFTKHAEGSVLIELGETRVLCTASIEDKVAPHLYGTSKGWITAEYGMLPRATHSRSKREAARGKQTGRTVEIQRLIGRSLRAAVDLDLLGPRTITVDCDVLQADGGTRTASITGGWLALAWAIRQLRSRGAIAQDPMRFPIAAISVGVVGGQPHLDLNYEEDSTAEVDMNVIGNAAGELIEVQGTAEGKVFDRATLDAMLDLATEGIRTLVDEQRKALG